MSVKDYTYEEGRFEVTPEVKADFDTAGYIVVRNLLSEAELQRVKSVMNEDDEVLKKYSYGMDDGAGKQAMICLWCQPGDDVSGRLFKSDKVAGTCERLLGGRMDHYHTKLIMKEAYSGGRWMWHQDYGYWYGSAFLCPDLITVFVALDPCRQDNGCLQVLEGSHRCGRIEHKKTSGQVGADLERVEQIKPRCAHKYVEMEPGDALFFHCNLLHTSSQNNGPNRRWALLCAYNREDNKPYLDRIYPFCTKFDKVPNSAILESKLDWDLDSTNFHVQEERDQFWKNFEDETAKASA